MSFTANRIRQGAAGTGGGYEIDSSLRFNDDDSAYLSWTPSSAGNRKTWTFSCWFKRGNLSANSASQYNYQYIFAAAGNHYFALSGDDLDCLRILSHDGTLRMALVTEQVFRDHSAWYHIVFKLDTTQATDTNRFKLYVNGTEVTEFKSTANNYSKTYPAQNLDLAFNTAIAHYVGGPGANYFDGHMAEIHFVDGQALAPSEFGEFDSDYGHWKAKKFGGTHGTNGFYLDFETSGTLGNDASINSNNWTLNNLATSDQMVDSPTNNFATLNPLYTRGGNELTLSEGNLEASFVTPWKTAVGSMGASSGKWYFEATMSTNSDIYVGVTEASSVHPDPGNISAEGYGYRISGYIYLDGSYYSASMPTYTTGDVISVALDLDNGKIWWAKNGTWVSSGNPATGANPTGTGGSLSSDKLLTFAVSGYDGSGTGTVQVNFGSDATFAGYKSPSTTYSDGTYGEFFYQPPSGFKALCSLNIPDPAVVPGEHFNAVTYTGNNTAGHAITGVGFQPDWTYIKSRNVAGSSNMYDVIRGAGYGLTSNSTAGEAYTSDQFTSFDSDGFTLPADTAGYNNVNSRTYVAWNWKAGGTAVSNYDGSITSQVSANTNAGISVLTYSGNSTHDSTVGHGLNQKPDIVLIKRKSSSGANWYMNVGNLPGLSAAANMTAVFNSNVAVLGYNVGQYYWRSAAPGASTFTLASSGDLNSTGQSYVAFCFHSVDGFSKCGSYVANGTAGNGPFIYTGFRPKYVIFKDCTGANHWAILDTARDSYNKAVRVLASNTSDAVYNYNSGIDFVSNGIKIRDANGKWGDANARYLYMAFAEYPFKYSTAR